MKPEKQVRFIDFQVYAGPNGLEMDEQKAINEALFITYEPIRLWLREHTLKAPFRKLLVYVTDEHAEARWHGSVMVAIGICEATVAVDIPTFRKNAQDHRWVLGLVSHALSSVARDTGWTEDAFNGLVARLSEEPPPLVHVFEKLTRIDARSGVECRVWFSTQPGSTQIGVRISKPDGTGRDVVVATKPGRFYTEDYFPVVKSAIRRPNFVLLDKAGKTLASVPLDASGLH